MQLKIEVWLIRYIPVYIKYYTVVFLQIDLVNPTEAEFEILLDQLRERLNENHAECIYTIGSGGKVDHSDLCI